MKPRNRNRRVFQLEALEDRLTLSASASTTGLQTALDHIPGEHGRGAAQVERLQDGRSGDQISARQSGGGQQGQAQRNLNRNVAGLNRAVASLNQVLARLDRAGSGNPGAATRALDRVVAQLQQAAGRFDQGGATTTSGREVARASLQRALDNLGRLEDRVPDDRLEALRQVFQRNINRLSSSDGGDGQGGNQTGGGGQDGGTGQVGGGQQAQTQRAIDQAVAALNRTLDRFDRAVDRLGRADDDGDDRDDNGGRRDLTAAFANLQRAVTTLDRSLAGPGTTAGGQQAARAALQRALSSLGRVADGTIPTDQLGSIRTTLQGILDRFSSSGGNQG